MLFGNCANADEVDMNTNMLISLIEILVNSGWSTQLFGWDFAVFFVLVRQI